jgi:hypothetical protein
MKGFGPDALTDDLRFRGRGHSSSLWAIFGFSIGMAQSVFWHFMPFSLGEGYVAGGIGSLIGYGCGHVKGRLNLCKREVLSARVKPTSSRKTAFSISGLASGAMVLCKLSSVRLYAMIL